MEPENQTNDISWSQEMTKKLTEHFGKSSSHTYYAGIDPYDQIKSSPADKPIPAGTGILQQISPAQFTYNTSNNWLNELIDQRLSPIPENATPLTQTIFPFKEAVIHTVESEPGTYYFKKTLGYNEDSQELIIAEDIQTIKIVDPISVQNTDTGIQASQLIIAIADNLSIKEDKSEEETAALKHLKYALAFLEKDIMNKTSVKK